ncbi:MAG: hypothetical protein JNK72_17515 [Myxococcales bacterium]|nr:hypothetical protein [Myxococcales bacterium]
MANDRHAHPVHPLWVHALRAQLDALIVGAEAQVAAQIAGAAQLQSQREAALQASLDEAQRALQTAQEARDRSLDAQRSLEAEVARLEALVAASQRRHEEDAARVARAESEHSVLTARLEALGREAAEERASLLARVGALSERAEVLDEQFSAERDFVEAALAAKNTELFEALTQSFGAALEPTPAVLSALKTRRAEGVLTQALRLRGSMKSALSVAERGALGALAAAAGCELIEPSEGTRFSALAMEKVATRSDPAFEGLVLGCLMPGLRLGGSAGSLLHPRVIVATA